jgi:hypothetical protein
MPPQIFNSFLYLLPILFATESFSRESDCLRVCVQEIIFFRWNIALQQPHKQNKKPPVYVMKIGIHLCTHNN